MFRKGCCRVGVGDGVQQVDYPVRRLRFGTFEADLKTGQLSKHGRRLRLQEQPFRLLTILLERPGEFGHQGGAALAGFGLRRRPSTSTTA